MIKGDNLKTKSQEMKEQGIREALGKQIALIISDVLQKHCTVPPNHFSPNRHPKKLSTLNQENKMIKPTTEDFENFLTSYRQDA